MSPFVVFVCVSLFYCHWSIVVVIVSCLEGDACVASALPVVLLVAS